MINLLSTVSNTGIFRLLDLLIVVRNLMSNGEEINILDQDYYKRALEGEEVVEGRSFCVQRQKSSYSG